jgi:hypothetical protein
MTIWVSIVAGRVWLEHHSDKNGVRLPLMKYHCFAAQFVIVANDILCPPSESLSRGVVVLKTVGLDRNVEQEPERWVRYFYVEAFLAVVYAYPSLLLFALGRGCDGWEPVSQRIRQEDGQPVRQPLRIVLLVCPVSVGEWLWVSRVKRRSKRGCGHAYLASI